MEEAASRCRDVRDADRQYLGCLRIRDGVITLERMYFADEIRPADDLRPKGARVNKQELEMAESLIDRFRGNFDPSRFKDTYTKRLLDVIRRKRRGEEVHAAPEVEPEEVPDLLEALRASLEAHPGARASRIDRNAPAEALPEAARPRAASQQQAVLRRARLAAPKTDQLEPPSPDHQRIVPAPAALRPRRGSRPGDDDRRDPAACSGRQAQLRSRAG
jgi:DNA end-binding protein Ku